jgi:hypothetical protein
VVAAAIMRPAVAGRIHRQYGKKAPASVYAPAKGREKLEERLTPEERQLLFGRQPICLSRAEA